MSDSLFSSAGAEKKCPEPKLALTRLHLRSVGPAAARLDPLDLSHVTNGKSAGRVLWNLTNTGGKTTLIRLLTSTIVPNADSAMGGANIGEYVRSGDTSHILLEWDDVAIGRYVTGAVYEWPDRQQPADAPISKLKRHWYTFRSDHLQIDDLPFERDGRRQPQRAYLDDLGELLRNTPTAEGVVTDNQTKWARTLESRTSIDPTLFGYQMRMNDDEAGAGALVKKMASADAVVRFFVRALLDDAAWADFTTTLQTYATHAGRRHRLEAEREFFAALVGPLARLGATHAALLAAQDAEGLARLEADEVAAAVEQRRMVDMKKVDELKERVESQVRAHEILNAQENAGEARRAQLILEDARFEVVERDARFQEAERLLGKAETTRAAWEATEPVARWREAQARAEQAKAAADQAESGLRPYREAAASAGGGLSAKLASLAELSASEAGIADDEINLIDKDLNEAAAKRRAQADLAAKASAELSTIDAAVTKAEAHLRALVSDGHAGPGESAADARQRWEQLSNGLRREIKRLGERQSELRTDLRGLDKERELLLGEHGTADRELIGVATQLQSYQEESQTLSADPMVADLVAGGDIALANLEGLMSAIAGRAKQAEEQLRAVEAREGEVRRELAPLERGDLAATIDDVEELCSTLINAGIGAMTGWSWLASNSTSDHRPAVINNHPALADGVVVTDPTRLNEAEEALADAGERLPVAVWVSSVTDLTGLEGHSNSPSNPGFVVGPRRALYDPEWALRRKKELQTEQVELTVAHSDGAMAGQSARDAHSALALFSRRWGSVNVEALNAQAASLRSTLNRMEDELEEIRLQRDENTAETGDVEAALTDSNANLDSASHRHAEAATVAALVTDAETMADTRSESLRQRGAAEATIVELDRNAKSLASKRENSLERKLGSSLRADNYRQLQSQVGVEPDAEVPARSVGELEASFREAKIALDRATSGLGSEALEIAAVETSRQAADARQIVDRLDPIARERAEMLIGSLEGASAPQRQERIAGAAREVRDLVGRRADASTALEGAHQRVVDSSPRDREQHATLPGELQPRDREHAATLIETVVAQNAEARLARRTVAQEIADLRGRIRDVENDLVQLNAALVIHASAPETTGATWSGTASQAVAEVNRLHVHLGAAAEAVDQARGRRSEDGNILRAIANDRRWVEVNSPLKERSRADSDDLIAPQAAEMAHVAGQLRASIDADLAELSVHRDTLVTTLVGMCSTQRRLLNLVTRASRLPEGLADLSGQAAFKIDFEPLGEPEARGNLARRVDEWADVLADGRKLNREERIVWLCTATADTVVRKPNSGPWRVKVLKPEVSGVVTYKDPGRIPVEYSGGQELTLAVMLYCTLASVRSSQRSGGERPPGTLVLDNPFGAASNKVLIELQQALAARAGVQLVCATGINDPTIRSAFEGEASKVLEMRNDRDQRQYLSYLRVADPSVDDAVRGVVGGSRDQSDPAGYLSATGYRVRRSS